MVVVTRDMFGCVWARYCSSNDVHRLCSLNRDTCRDLLNYNLMLVLRVVGRDGLRIVQDVSRSISISRDHLRLLGGCLECQCVSRGCSLARGLGASGYVSWIGGGYGWFRVVIMLCRVAFIF